MLKALKKTMILALAAVLLVSASPAALAAESVELPFVGETSPEIPVMLEAPMITADLPEALNVPPGVPFTLTVGAAGRELQYQWYRNNAPIAGAVTESYSVAGADADSSGSYYCIVRNGAGAVQSRTCQVAVLIPPVLLTDINITAITLSVGDIITLSASASGNAQAQWYYVLNGTDIRPVSGQTGGTLSIPVTAEYNGADFYCQFVNEAGAVTTSFCRVTVNGPSPSPQIPVITKNPTGETVTAGGNALFIARADGTRTYVWRFINQNNISYDYTGIGGMFPGLSVSGGDTDTLSLRNIPEELNGWSVACLFRGEGGGEILSGKAYITVQSKTAGVTITQQPSAATMALDENENFTLSVIAAASDGGTLTYQWYSAPDTSATSMIPIAGAVNSSYKPSPRKEGTTYYRVAITLNRNGTASQPYFSSTVPVTFTAKEVHTHVYSDSWEHNDLSHWHQCTCGAHSGEAMHTYTWTIIVRPTADRDGQQKGVCTVCGYETVQPIPAGSMPEATATPTPAPTAVPRKSSHTGLLLLLGLAALGILGTAGYVAFRILRGEEEDDYDDEDDGDEEYDEDEEKESPWTTLLEKIGKKNGSRSGSHRRNSRK